MVTEAIIHRPKRIATRLGIFAQVTHAVAPKLGEIVMNTGYRMFPDSPSAKTRRADQPKATSEQIAFAALMRGIHW